jgi:hypothetical protein
MVGGVSRSYSFDLYLVDGRVRRTDPGWRWNGPPIPDTKPSYKAFFVGQRGRIWVQLHTEARQISEDAAGPPQDAPWMHDALQRWVEPSAFDVFDPDGRYLRRVEATGPICFGRLTCPRSAGAYAISGVARTGLEDLAGRKPHG